MGSYAQEAEYRVVQSSWNSNYRRQGRYVFRSMYESNGGRTLIGREMVEYDRSGGYRDRSNADNRWILRCYLDGTATFRKNKFNSDVNRYNVTQPFWIMLQKYYYVDTTIEAQSYRDEVVVLRRKPLSDYAKLIANAEANLGDYLVQKYNLQGEKA